MISTSTNLLRPELSRIPEFFHGYVSRVSEYDLDTAFEKQFPAFLQLLSAIPPEKRLYRYADDKWSVQEVLQHIIDSERIFGYRALCIARKEKTSLPPFDENAYAAHSEAERRNWEDMVKEFELTRKSNELLFKSFSEEQLNTTGTASGKSIYVLGLGYIIVGHVSHHVEVLKERYLN